MNIRAIFIMCLVCCVLTSLCSSAEPSSQPNVVLILADDLAIGDLDGGGSGRCRTPNLEKLASESVRFNQAYSASCVCAPARAALLTGRYPHRTGVVTLNMNKFPKLTRLRTDETTIADLMSKAGYVTGLVGKWHLGRGKEYHPTARGFDEFQGFDGSQELSYFDYPLDVNGKTLAIKDKYLTDDLTERAIDFVRRHQSHPFFLHLAHYAPHRPLEAPPKLIEAYRKSGFNDATATIYAMIEVMDRGIGKLLREIDSLGLAENTIVIFASDNGPDPLTGDRFNRDLRGTKYQVYEGGIRVPLFVRWSRTLDPGPRNQSVHFVDIVPTILDLCDIELRPALPIDGKSFKGVLLDSTVDFTPVRFWQWNRGSPNYTHNAAIREGDFKLVRPFITRGITVEDSPKPAVLFHLLHDPTESQNIAELHPDLVSKMHAKLEHWANSIENDRNRPVGTKPGQ